MGKKIYVQVAYKLESEATVLREFQPLLAIDDQYPKYVVTMDEFWKDDIDGVEEIYELSANDYILRFTDISS